MKAKVAFHKLIQNTQDVAANDPNQIHMISQAFVTLEVGGKQYGDMSVVLQQSFGTDYATEPIEAETPLGSYTRNWNHNDLGTRLKIIIAAPSACSYALARAAALA